MDKQDFLALIEKFLAGETNAEEDRILLNYYQSFQVTDTWNDDVLGTREQVETRIWQHIKQETDEIGPKKQKIRLLIPWGKLAAAVSIILIIGTGMFKREFIYNLFFPVHYIYATTKYAERKILTLSDGSKIWLSPGSSLNYPDDFRSDTREVSLVGEAFFEVAKNKSQPFIIHSDKVNTKVTGTSFNIQAYKDQTVVSVTVVTGKVTVAANANKVILIPNQRAIFDRLKNELDKKDYPNAAKMLARKEGSFYYDGAKVYDIIQDIHREYNLEIKTIGDLSSCTYYGNFISGESPKVFLKKLCVAINGDLQEEGNVYILTGGKCL